MIIDEARRKAVGVPDLLMYASLIDDGVMLLQNGALMACWSYRGPDLSSSTYEEMDNISRQLNGLLKLGSNWMIHCDAIRSYAPGYPDEGYFPDTATRLIDLERRGQFMQEGEHLSSDYYLTLTYLPPVEKEERMKGYAFSSPDGPRHGVAEQVLKYFKDKVASFDVMFALILRGKRLKRTEETDHFGNPLYYDEQLRFVRRCVQGEDFKFALPEIPAYLHDMIGAIDLLAGVSPRIGKRHIGVVAIDAFPSYSMPGFLSVLDALPFEYRWNTRAVLHDPEDARPILESRFKKWKGMERGFLDQLLGKKNGRINEFASHQAGDNQQAISVAASGDVLFSWYSSNVILLDEDKDRLGENRKQVVKALKNAGMGARIEDLNAVEAWLGTLPGDGNRNPRRFYLHTLNIADSLPISAIWPGEKECPSALMPPNSPPLLMASSTGATPYAFNVHVGDLGHFVMFGPPGSGKSTALALIAAQWFRYRDARVIVFDKGYSTYVLNQASGGTFYDLMGESNAITFCPLADLETSATRAWACGYIETLVSMNGLPVDPEVRNAINDAIQKMSRSKDSRSLWEFVSTVQHRGVRDAMKDFTSEGACGALLDARTDSLRHSRFTVFEMGALLGSGDSSGNSANSRALVAVLLYLFENIRRQMDGTPTMILVDEGWAYLKFKQFRDKFGEWLREMRKMNAVVGLATQSLSDVQDSDISNLIRDTVATYLILANSGARNENSQEIYRTFGLNDREILNVATMTPKKDYYVTSADGKRTISFGIGEVAMSFVGVSSFELRLKAKELQEEYGDRWVSEWLRWRASRLGARGKHLPGWADLYDRLESERKQIGGSL